MVFGSFEKSKQRIAYNDLISCHFACSTSSVIPKLHKKFEENQTTLKQSIIENWQTIIYKMTKMFQSQ